MHDIERLEFSSSDTDQTRDVLLDTLGWRLAGRQSLHSHQSVTVSMRKAPGLVGSAYAVAPGRLTFDVVGSDFVVVTILVEGSVELTGEDGTERFGAGDVYIANQPGVRQTSRTEGCHALSTTLPTGVLTRVAHLERDRGAPRRPSVHFESRTPHPGLGHRWRHASRLVDDLLRDPVTARARLVVAPAARWLSAVALSTFPNDAVQDPRHPRNVAASATVRRAVAFIDSNPHRDIGLADIAAAAYVTPRALQLAFRRHLDTTPMSHLRRVRLDHARDDLLRSAPSDGTTVTDVAARWGFTASAFTRLYRSTYGEVPSITLRRR